MCTDISTYMFMCTDRSTDRFMCTGRSTNMFMCTYIDTHISKCTHSDTDVCVHIQVLILRLIVTGICANKRVLTGLCVPEGYL